MARAYWQLNRRCLTRLAHEAVHNPTALTRWFTCPICRYRGPFTSFLSRRYARCPSCYSAERHRLMYLVLKQLRQQYTFDQMRMLHFAPERFFQKRFRKWFSFYETADIARPHVDHQIDMRDMATIPDSSFDIVVASHVLEHIKEDAEALREVARILAPGGIALLPVPIVAHQTIEYPHSVSTEFNHVRAPGPDYFDRFEPHFLSVSLHRSSDVSERYQTWAWEDRSTWPTSDFPFRRPMMGYRHVDIVPVCCK
jgi:predicted SAM-dependent methyltransferase